MIISCEKLLRKGMNEEIKQGSPAKNLFRETPPRKQGFSADVKK